MAKSDSWRPRLSIELSEQQFKELQDLFPWGTKQAFFSMLIDELIDILKAKGEMAVIAVLAGGIKYREMSRTLSEMENKDG